MNKLLFSSVIFSFFSFSVFSSVSLATPQSIELKDSNMAMTEAGKDNELVDSSKIDSFTIDTLDQQQMFSQSIDENAIDVSSAIAAGRVTYRAYKWQRGRTIGISTAVIRELCGDLDGCELRMGMYNWDNTGRVASRHSLFYYNNINRAWRASWADRAGSDYNGVTQHVMNAWSCYFTDGRYFNWSNLGDGSVGFGLLSWNQYNAECRLTIID